MSTLPDDKMTNTAPKLYVKQCDMSRLAIRIDGLLLTRNIDFKLIHLSGCKYICCDAAMNYR